MASWNEFRAAAPEMAERGWALLAKRGDEGFLTTIRGDGLPRSHPVNVGVVDGRLLTFVQVASAKARDLLEDGRYALHAHQDPAEPHEFLVRGRARVVDDPVLRAAAIATWAFTPGDDYPLLELDVEHALFGDRGDPNAWPPAYASWKPAGAGSVSR